MFMEPAQQGATDTEYGSVVGPLEQGTTRMVNHGAQRVV